METKKAYLKTLSVNGYGWNGKINGEILNVKWVIPYKQLQWRLCYEVRYSREIMDILGDNKVITNIDYVPISDVENGAYEIVDYFENN